MAAGEILQEAAELIDKRGRHRDLGPERSMRRTVGAFNTLTGHTLTESQGWLFMAVLKLARATAGELHKDDLLDAAAYCALMLEHELLAVSL